MFNAIIEKASNLILTLKPTKRLPISYTIFAQGQNSITYNTIKSASTCSSHKKKQLEPSSIYIIWSTTVRNPSQQAMRLESRLISGQSIWSHQQGVLQFFSFLSPPTTKKETTFLCSFRAKMCDELLILYLIKNSINHRQYKKWMFGNGVRWWWWWAIEMRSETVNLLLLYWRFYIFLCIIN